MRKMFLGATGSIASIKLYDLYKSLNKQNVDLIWSVTDSAKCYVLNTLKNNLEKEQKNTYSNEIVNILNEINELLMTCINNGGKGILLKSNFLNWSDILRENNQYITGFMDSFEEGIDIEGTTSKQKGKIKHINLAQGVDCALIAPTTANTLSKIVNGITDNFILETIRAMPNNKKIYLALAMNTNMLQDPFIQRNIKLLNEYGGKKYEIIDPKEGLLQCGINGLGAMEDIEKIINIINY